MSTLEGTRLHQKGQVYIRRDMFTSEGTCLHQKGHVYIRRDMFTSEGTHLHHKFIKSDSVCVCVFVCVHVFVCVRACARVCVVLQALDQVAHLPVGGHCQQSKTYVCQKCY